MCRRVCECVVSLGSRASPDQRRIDIAHDGLKKSAACLGVTFTRRGGGGGGSALQNMSVMVFQMLLLIVCHHVGVPNTVVTAVV
jgi:hypothetical protein